MTAPDRKATAPEVKPFDLLAARAARAEVARAGTPFALGEHEFTVPPQDDWDLDAMIALSDGDMVTFFRLVLPDDHLAIFAEAVTTHKLKIGDLKDMFGQIAQSAGFKSLGELLASSGS
ncbi:hypothetical protein [Frankia sp. Cr1]|uniref:hypothetical protein n=1 Tax=Frankia sp. Cr1 TaxID=3073931 RepID=UPI002AD550A0|nr:hypothetical protein [Frankia sp. Cr1]